MFLDEGALESFTPGWRVGLDVFALGLFFEDVTLGVRTLAIKS